jgi:hypothetical protein
VPRRSGRSSLRPHPIRPPSRGCAPSSATGRNACLCDRPVESIPASSLHVFLDGNFPATTTSIAALPRQDSEILVTINDGGDAPRACAALCWSATGRLCRRVVDRASRVIAWNDFAA